MPPHHADPARAHTGEGRAHPSRFRQQARDRAAVLNPADEAAWARHEGCLRLLRNGHDLEDFAAEIPPVNGTLLIFPNGPDTWHGHRQYVGPRHTIQLNYMTNDTRARNELRRHRLSALTKRLPWVA